MVGSIDPGRGTLRGVHWLPEIAALFGTPVAETILASGHMRSHQQAGHMTASDPILTLAVPLASRGPSTYGPRLALRLAGVTTGVMVPG